jgi:CheY-like chemotaxis protein
MVAQLAANEDGTLKKIRVSLPLKASSQQASTFKPARAMSGRSVWLVDMTPINNRALQAEFESWEMQVTNATLSELTTARLDTLPDVILVNVPVEDARAEEQVAQLAQWMSAEPAVKARVFVYASQLQRSLLSALTDNFHFIEKPVARDELLNVLTSVQRQNSDEAFEQQWHGSRILVAEDNLVNQKVLVKLLERLGARVETCANGQEAVQLASGDEPYDLIVMDCLMPRMDGLEATRLIRQNELGTGTHMPIVALTGEDTPEQERACLAAGMDDFTVKPVTYENLVTLMQRWLGNR